MKSDNKENWTDMQSESYNQIGNSFGKTKRVGIYIRQSLSMVSNNMVNSRRIFTGKKKALNVQITNTVIPNMQVHSESDSADLMKKVKAKYV